VTRVVTLGYACVDYRFSIERFPPELARTPVNAFRVGVGGPAAVGAITVARLGGAAVFLGRRGDDDAGRRVEARLRADGVDTQHFRAFPGARTPASAVLIVPGGERYVFPYLGEGLPDDADWLPMDELAGARVVLVDARWLAGATRLAEAARRRALPVVLDLDRESHDAWNLARLATHVIADQEAAEASGDADAMLRRLADLGTWGAVTLGGDGVVHSGGRIPAFRVAARDTTGAGDVFHGAFALALAEGQGEQAALTFAAAAAAQRCALAEVPRRGDVTRLLSTAIR